MRLLLLSAAIAPLMLLPSCVGAPEREPHRAAAPVAKPAPVPAPVSRPAPAQWSDRPATPGNWSYAADSAGSTAIFTGPVSGASLTLRCDTASRRISVIRAGAPQGVMTVRTSYGAVSWPATASPAGTAAARAANDATLDQMAYSRGRFAVEVAGQDMLILPPWAEVGRVIEDCRG